VLRLALLMRIPAVKIRAKAAAEVDPGFLTRARGGKPSLLPNEGRGRPMKKQAKNRYQASFKAKVALAEAGRYPRGMKSNTKSSITLPAEEIRLVRSLKAKLKIRTNVEVVRRGLRLLQATTDRAELQEAYRRASKAVRSATRKEIEELDRLSGEGLD
jgi:hypothetical protein